MLKPNIKGQRESTTVGVVVATILTGAKPDHQRNRDTKKKPTTKRSWSEVKRGVNDG